MRETGIGFGIKFFFFFNACVYFLVKIDFYYIFYNFTIYCTGCPVGMESRFPTEKNENEIR